MASEAAADPTPDWAYRVLKELHTSIVRVEFTGADGGTQWLTGLKVGGGTVVTLTLSGLFRSWPDLGELVVTDADGAHPGGISFMATSDPEHPSAAISAENLADGSWTPRPRRSESLRPGEPVLSVTRSPAGVRYTLGTFAGTAPFNKDGSGIVVVVAFEEEETPPLGAALFDEEGAFVGFAHSQYRGGLIGATAGEKVFVPN